MQSIVGTCHGSRSVQLADKMPSGKTSLDCSNADYRSNGDKSK